MGFKQKRILALLFSILGVFFLLHFATQQIEKKLHTAINSKIVVLNNSTPYVITKEHIDISIFKRSFFLQDVLILPDSLESDPNAIQPHLSVSRIEGLQFEILPLLLNNKLRLGKIEVNGVEVVQRDKRNPTLARGAMNSPKKNKNKWLKEIGIDSILIKDFVFATLNNKLNDTLFKVTGKSLTFSNVLFEKLQKENQLFFNSPNLVVTANTIESGSSHAQFSLSTLQLNFKQQSISVSDFKYGHSDSLKIKTDQQLYSTPVNFIHLPTLHGFGIVTDTLLYSKKLLADSLVITNAQIASMKNTNKPWNKEKVIPLPQKMLREIAPRIGLNNLVIKNATVDYTEIHERKEVGIPMDQLNVEIKNFGGTSTSFTNEEKSMHIALQGRLFKDFSFYINLDYLDPMRYDGFEFKGSTGSFNFETFNPIMVPTSNIKFESGHVSRIDFNGSGNGEETTGEFVMVYNNLTATVLKENGYKKNKTFSWLANTAVRKQNPKNGKLKSAQMHYQRVPYKGFGNYMFKTIESGLINSVYPFGKRKTYID